MPRRGAITPRAIEPDKRHNSRLVQQVINKVMVDGKKSTAEKIVYDALEQISQKTANDPVITLKKAVENVKPAIEVRSKRVGGAAYQVPMQVNRTRQQSLAIRWIMAAIHEKKGRPTHESLANELVAAYNREGAAITRRENVHRMADANKAFAHFAW